MWRWFAWYRARVPEGQEALILNLDETSVRYFYEARKGLLAARGPGAQPGRQNLRNTSKAQQRRAFTHVAIICDDTEVQAQLPQVLLCSEQLLRRRDELALRGQLPPNVHLWRRPSGWVTKESFAQVMRLLGEVLARSWPGRPAILIMDAHRVHWSPSVLRACERAGVWVLIVPAVCTHFLQPLDTDCFARYKLALRQELELAMSEGENRDLSCERVMGCVARVVRRVLQGTPWRSVFERNGFGRQRFQLRPSLLERLHWESAPELGGGLPSLPEFQSIFPLRSWIPFAELLLPAALGGEGALARRGAPRPADARPAGGGEPHAAAAALEPGRAGPSAASSSSAPWRPPAAPEAAAAGLPGRPMTRSYSKRLREGSSATGRPEETRSPRRKPYGRRLPGGPSFPRSKS